jgi:hypothetical protein
MPSVYVIRHDGERWLIFAGKSCILMCGDEMTARRTVADAEASLCRRDFAEEAAVRATAAGLSRHPIR